MVALTLDEYRLQVFLKLKACGEPARTREILAEVHMMLTSSRLSESGQRPVREAPYRPTLEKEQEVAIS